MIRSIVARRGGWRVSVAAATALALLLSAPVAGAAEMPVPPQMQASLFAKILTFDRNLKVRAGKDLRIAVLYQKKVRSSLEAQEEFVRAMCGDPGQRIEGLALTCMALEWTDAADVEAALVQNGIRFLYVAPLRAVAIEEIVAISRTRRITTLTGVPGYVEKGIALGLTLRAERPLILVDLAGARAEGANFNSQLLKLARVVGPEPSAVRAGLGGGSAP
ncbi:MAG: YfiR/HmsC family protein [Acidobacteriota bacterium]